MYLTLKCGYILSEDQNIKNEYKVMALQPRKQENMLSGLEALPCVFPSDLEVGEHMIIQFVTPWLKK